MSDHKVEVSKFKGPSIQAFKFKYPLTNYDRIRDRPGDGPHGECNYYRCLLLIPKDKALPLQLHLQSNRG